MKIRIAGWDHTQVYVSARFPEDFLVPVAGRYGWMRAFAMAKGTGVFAELLRCFKSWRLVRGPLLVRRTDRRGLFFALDFV
ncbi:MAG: hypothetical protein AAFR88_06410, partial [Pseudomonadota bacterium]